MLLVNCAHIGYSDIRGDHFLFKCEGRFLDRRLELVQNCIRSAVLQILESKLASERCCGKQHLSVWRSALSWWKHRSVYVTVSLCNIITWDFVMSTQSVSETETENLSRRKSACWKYQNASSGYWIHDVKKTPWAISIAGGEWGKFLLRMINRQPKLHDIAVQAFSGSPFLTCLLVLHYSTLK